MFTYLVFAIAFHRVTPGSKLFANQDISYGVYLYAFPIQQAAVHWLGLRDPVSLFFAALPVTLILAYGSWRLVELPLIVQASRLCGASKALAFTQTTSKQVN